MKLVTYNFGMIVPLVVFDSIIQLYNGFIRTFDNLEKTTIIKNQQAGNSLSVIEGMGFDQESFQSLLVKSYSGCTRVDNLSNRVCNGGGRRIHDGINCST